MNLKHIALAFALVASSAAWATEGTKFYTHKSGMQSWVGDSGDTKPTATTVPIGSSFYETDTHQRYRVDDTGAWVNWAVPTYKTHADAGERIEDSTTGTDYSSTSMECGQSAEIDLSGNTSTTVYNGPAILCGYTLSVTVGTAAVTIDDNVTAKKTLPVSWPIGYYGPMGSIFETSLVVNPADTSTGTLQIEYRPLDADTTWAP